MKVKKIYFKNYSDFEKYTNGEKFSKNTIKRRLEKTTDSHVVYVSMDQHWQVTEEIHVDKKRILKKEAKKVLSLIKRGLTITESCIEEGRMVWQEFLYAGRYATKRDINKAIRDIMNEKGIELFICNKAIMAINKETGVIYDIC